MLGLTWVQALGAFNFSSKVAFDQDTAHALQDIRLAAAPDDVVAYLPSDLTASAIWGHAEESTNFAIMAMTGLDGYFSSEAYTKFFAVPGLSGRNPAEVLAQANASMSSGATMSSPSSKAISRMPPPRASQKTMCDGLSSRGMHCRAFRPLQHRGGRLGILLCTGFIRSILCKQPRCRVLFGVWNRP